MSEGSRFSNEMKEFYRSQQAPADTAEALREQIRQHEYADQHRGLLDRATTNVLNGGDEKSLTALRELEQRVSQGKVQAGEIAAAIKADRDAIKWQGEVSMYGTGFMKAATLFLPGRGKIPWMASGAVHSIDQIKVAPDISTTQMLTDGVLGFGKGAALKVTMDKVGASSWRTWEKGLVIGGAGGALETSMHRENWLTPDGKVDVLGGLGRTTQSTFMGAGAGAVTFHVGHKVFKGISTKLTNGALERSPLASNMGVGFSFGATGGFTGEAMNQIQKGEFDPVQLAVRSVLQGGVDMFAGGAGYKAGQLYMPKETIGAHPAFSENNGPTLVDQVRGWGTQAKTWGENFLKPTELKSDGTFASKSRKNDRRDFEDGEDGGSGGRGKRKERTFQSFEELAAARQKEQQEQRTQEESGGWGNSEPVAESGGKGKTEKRAETEPVVEETVTEQRTPQIERTDAKQPATVTELDTAQAALQARLDALALEGKLKGVPKDATKLFKSLDKILEEANGNQPIPAMEIAVIKNASRYKQLPDMIAQAVAKAEAARAEKVVSESEEIVSGGDRRSAETAKGKEVVVDPYAELLRRAAEGDNLDVVQRSELNRLHEGRMSAEMDKLTLEERIAATKRELESQRQPQEEVREEPKPEVVEEGQAIERTVTADGKTFKIPEINVAAETNNMHGSTFSGGNRLLTQAVTDAYLAIGAEGKVQADAIANLRKVATENPALKTALETIASKHPEIDAVIKTALEGVVAPEPGSQQHDLLNIVTRRPNEMKQMVEAASELAVRASRGDAAAKQQLDEMARRSIDATEVSKPVFDVHEGMARVAHQRPDLARTIYESFKDSMPNNLLAEFGVRFAKDAARGDAEGVRMLQELAREHNQPEVRDALFKVGEREEHRDILEPLYEVYKPNLTMDQKAWVGGKIMRDIAAAKEAAQAELESAASANRTLDPKFEAAAEALQQKFNTFAKDNPEMLLTMDNLAKSWSKESPAFENIFQEAYGLTGGRPNDVPAMVAAARYFERAQLDLGQSAKDLRTHFENAVASRVNEGYTREAAESQILENFAKVARMHGIEEANILKHIVTGPEGEIVVIKAAADYVQGKHQELVGQESQPGLALEVMKQANQAVENRVQQGYSREVAQKEILEKLESTSRITGLEDVSFFRRVMEAGLKPSEIEVMGEASKIFEAVQAAKLAAEKGEAIPAPPHPGQFMDGIRLAVAARKAEGQSAVDSVLALKKGLDVIARERGFENADFLINEIVMSATPAMEFTPEYMAQKNKTPEQIAALKQVMETEQNAIQLGKEMLQRHMEDRKAVANNTPRKELPSGEELVREVFKGVYEHLNGGEKPMDFIVRMRERLETEAALRGENDANFMLPLLAEGFLPGVRRPAGTEPKEPAPTAELSQAEIAHRLAEFRQIVGNSKFPEDPMFKVSETDSRVEKMNRWFEHQMQVRKELFDWMNNNKAFWPYVREYAEYSPNSPVVAMIDGFPPMESHFLQGFGVYPRELAPAQPRAPKVEREAVREEVAREEVPRQEVVERGEDLLEPKADLHAEYRQAMKDMHSQDGDVMFNAAHNERYLWEPRDGGLRHFQRWLAIMKANVEHQPPAWKQLLQRPEVEMMSDRALFDWFSDANQAKPLNPRNWDGNKNNTPDDRAEMLTKAFDAFKTEAKPQARTESEEPVKPQEFDPTNPEVVAGVKLATLLSSNRPLLADVLFKMGERSPYKVQFKQLFMAMAENATSGEQIGNVMNAMNEAQNLFRRHSNATRPPNPNPRPGQRPREVEQLTQEEINELPILALKWIRFAQSEAAKTNPANPDEVGKLIDGITRQTIQVDRPRPGGRPGGGRPGGGGDRN
ncbi:MAG: hypothetical protein IT343_17830 [Candidatus Melainabacteria bacterium]|nr:hypothetical protein [Candidatus Melainabacteria bacterium]